MANLDKFNFIPTKGFLDSNYYSDPSNEVETRTQLQSLHTQTQTFINNLIDKLNTNGSYYTSTPTISGVVDSNGNPITTVGGQLEWFANNLIVGQSDIRKLRINEENQTEYYNGKKWNLLGSGGHQILNDSGEELPSLPKLQFKNTNIHAKNRTIIVEGVKGEQGEIGPKGEQGIQGEKGDKGESGVIAPSFGYFTLSIDSEGNVYVNYDTDTQTPQFSIDDDGNFYLVTTD